MSFLNILSIIMLLLYEMEYLVTPKVKSLLFNLNLEIMVLSFVNSAAQLMCRLWVLGQLLCDTFNFLISWSQNGCHSSKHHVPHS